THFCVDENRFGKWAPWPTEINLIYLFIFGCQYTGFKHKTVGIIACCGRCGNIRVAKTFYRATEKISGRRAEDEICRPVYEAFLQIDTCASLREIECVLVAEDITVADNNAISLCVQSHGLSYPACRIGDSQIFQRAVVSGNQYRIRGISAEIWVASSIDSPKGLSRIIIKLNDGLSSPFTFQRHITFK